MSAPIDFSRPMAAPGSAPCAACGRPLVGQYFGLNGRAFCTACHDQVVRPPGSAPLRLLTAAGLGLGAALASAAVWGGIRIATEMNIGLIAVAAGYLVGRAVRFGSKNRGGLAYQVLAAVLAYLACSFSYGIEVAYYLAFKSDSQHGVFAAIAVVAEFAFAGPFLIGAKHFLSMLIMAFGVWQAWQLNRPLRLAFTGPHPISPGGGFTAFPLGAAPPSAPAPIAVVIQPAPLVVPPPPPAPPSA